MAHRKRVSVGDSNQVGVHYQHTYAQIISLLSPRKLRAVVGRGSAKTTEIQVDRLIKVVLSMPGAPLCWVADTFSNLSSNILPGVLEGLERKGFIEGTHYVVEKEPPTFTAKERSALPKWLQKTFWKPVNKLVTYKRTITFYTGTNIRFGSLDRPSTLAGASYVYVFGDEVKYFKREKINNLMKAVRGYSIQFSRSPFYRGYSFTTDMPDTSRIGEYDWILKDFTPMETKMWVLLMQTALVCDQAKHEYVAAKLEWEQSQSPADQAEYLKKLRTANLWDARCQELRMLPQLSTFMLLASSYINADILTADWFADALSEQSADFKAAVLSIKPSLESGDRFYTALSESHFYFDSIDEQAYDTFELREAEDCRVLKHLDLERNIEIGVDFGNMCSMSIGQESMNEYRVVKFMYTLSPEGIRQLADKFIAYFEPMRNKMIFAYYDRSGNAQLATGTNYATDLKHALEFDADEKKTGWRVQLMSRKQGNITQTDEYYFMQVFMSGTSRKLPKLLIDAHQCKPLKASLEGARTQITKGRICKDKRSEKLPTHRLPLESTNPSDSFKYLLMRKNLIALAKHKGGSGHSPDPSVG